MKHLIASGTIFENTEYKCPGCTFCIMEKLNLLQKQINNIEEQLVPKPKNYDIPDFYGTDYL